jgi:phage replication-related protein YjqB (UPF0714/DUF867 family)
MSNNQGSFHAQFEVEPDEHRVHPEHCKANETQIKNIGRHSREQVRIEFPTANGILGAIYTVSSFFLNHAGGVILGNRIGDLNNCQPSGNACKGEVKAQIMIEGLDYDEEAEEKGELIEHLNHDVQNSKLVVIAPHGGEIEQWTDVEAEYVANHFSTDRVSLWLCKGFSYKDNEDALERWHITSTEISEKSFPKLNTIIGPNPTFNYSIAFHGWKEDSICVGGNPENPDTGLKGDIKVAIKKALEERNSDIEVNVSPCPTGKFNGDKPENIVNRLGTNGIQIEQCKIARRDYHDVIAQAVANVIGTRINV